MATRDIAQLENLLRSILNNKSANQTQVIEEVNDSSSHCSSQIVDVKSLAADDINMALMKAFGGATAAPPSGRDAEDSNQCNLSSQHLISEVPNTKSHASTFEGHVKSTTGKSSEDTIE